jgi:hypothetical protein
MRKRTEVVSIDEGKKGVSRKGEESHRVIFSIAGERFAIDLFSRVSCLPASGESAKPSVLPLSRKSGKPGGSSSGSRKAAQVRQREG